METTQSTDLLAKTGATEGPKVRAVEPILRPKFPKDDVGFQAELKRRVDAFFKGSGRRERDCWQMYLKTAIVLAWFAASYVLLVFFADAWWQALPLAISLAFSMAAIGFNVQHLSNRRADMP